MNYIRACEEIQNLLEMRGVHCEYTKHAFSGEKWDMLSLIYMGIGKNIFSLELKNLGLTGTVLKRNSSFQLISM